MVKRNKKTYYIGDVAFNVVEIEVNPPLVNDNKTHSVLIESKDGKQVWPTNEPIIIEFSK